MRWIGLTGGIGTGKSTVAKLLKQSGVPVVDADELAKQALGPGSQASMKVLSHFGAAISDGKSGIDRRKLAAVVFTDPVQLAKLESFVHPFVQEKVHQFRAHCAQQGADFAVYDVPLLYEKNLQGQFDRVVVVGSTLESQILRLEARAGLARDEVLQRIQNQVDLQEKMRKADDVIWNEGSLAALELQVKAWIQKVRGLPSKA